MYLADPCDSNDYHAAWQCQIPLSRVMKWGTTNYAHRPDQRDEKDIDTFDAVPVFCFCWERASICYKEQAFQVEMPRLWPRALCSASEMM